MAHLHPLRQTRTDRGHWPIVALITLQVMIKTEKEMPVAGEEEGNVWIQGYDAVHCLPRCRGVSNNPLRK